MRAWGAKRGAGRDSCAAVYFGLGRRRGHGHGGGEGCWRERDAGGRQSYLQLRRIVKMIVAWHAPGLVGCVLVAQARPSLCDPRDCNPPCTSVHRVFKARILECCC